MRTLFLLRGLPASGKSTLASRLGVEPIEADQFFMVDGEYRFDPSKLSAAHADCQARTRVALAAGGDVVVANTFTQRWELEPYLQIAEQHSIEGESVRVCVLDLFDGGETDATLAGRNAHGVPVAAIAAMRERYEHDWRNGNPVPPWERK